MAEFEISAEADEDLSSIFLFSFRTFGEAQADRYQDGLRSTFRLLADAPGLGRSAESKRAPKMRRLRRGEHVIFYLPTDFGIRVVRVLHVKMDHLRRLLDDDDED